MPTKLIFDEDRLTIYLSGEIDHHKSREIREETDPKILEEKPKEIVFNFKDVSFMDSSGIGLIMGRYKLANEYGGKIFISDASLYLKRVMKLAGISSIVTMLDSKSKNKED